MLKCKSTGLVLDERLYTGSATPPDSFADRSRWGNNGVHTAITWVRLPSGLWVRSFNGTTSIVNCGNPASIASAVSQLTVLTWVMAATQPGDKGVITRMRDGENTRSWGLISSGVTDKFYTIISGAGTYPATCKHYVTSITVFNSAWHQIGFTFNLGTLTLYVDGLADTTPTKTVDNELTTLYSTTANLTIGAMGLPSGFFKGMLSPCRIRSRALSATEIRKRFTATRAWFGV